MPAPTQTPFFTDLGAAWDYILFFGFFGLYFGTLIGAVAGVVWALRRKKVK